MDDFLKLLPKSYDYKIEKSEPLGNCDTDFKITLVTIVNLPTVANAYKYKMNFIYGIVHFIKLMPHTYIHTVAILRHSYVLYTFAR